MARANVDGTIETLLNDPMTRAVMRADGVDREELRELLRQVAAERRPAPRTTQWMARPAACCRGGEACAW